MSGGKSKLEKGVFVISLDLELAWGTRGDKNLKDDYIAERGVVQKLLSLFEKYQISATWAAVGHLFIEKCSPVNGIKHPEIIRPNYYSGGDWFDIDPASDLRRDPLWYGKDIIDSIKACPVHQEIGCHTYSHVYFEEGLNKECFDSELKACKLVADEKNISLKSFVYPKNRIGHLGSLKENGFVCYRGVDKNWYAQFGRAVKKMAHVIDNYFIPSAPAVEPEFIEGLWNIPGSYFYPHARSWAKYLPASARIRKSVSGLNKAADENKIFHLWFHPFNLSSDPDGLLGGLDSIFSEFKKLKDEGKMENKTMLALAESL